MSESIFGLNQDLPCPLRFIQLANLLLNERKKAGRIFQGFPQKSPFSDAEVVFLLNTIMQTDVTGELLTQQAELHHFCMRWAAFGFPHFELTQDLTTALMLTDATNVKTGEVNWPFPSFMISVPKDSPSPIVYTDMENENAVEGRHIMVHSMLVPCEEYGYSFQGAFEEAERVTKDKRKFWLNFEKIASEVPTVIRTVIRVMDKEDLFSVFHANQWPGEEEPIASWIRCGGPDRTGNLNEKDHYAMTAAARLITNLSLYLHEKQAEGKWSNREAFNRQARASKGMVTTPSGWIMGSEIKLPEHYHAMARTYSEQGFRQGAKKEFKVQAQQVVMGHWRRQSIKERILLQTSVHHPKDGRPQRWIAPYDRNRDSKLGFIKNYRVDLE